MSNVRLIARLDIKGPNLIKGVHLEGLRKIGDPNLFAKRYYEQGIDEILYLDVVASLYERSNLLDIVRRTTEKVFIPMTVGGGLRTVEDVRDVLRAGADKVALNTAALKEPELISRLSRCFGAQCVVLSIEAKSVGPCRWETYHDNGRERGGLDVVEWAKRGHALGAGEILLTSIDREGTGKGFDVELVKAVSEAVPIPVIASGGMGGHDDLEKAVREGAADAIAIASLFHYGKMTVAEVRQEALRRGIGVRRAAVCRS